MTSHYLLKPMNRYHFIFLVVIAIVVLSVSGCAKKEDESAKTATTQPANAVQPTQNAPSGAAASTTPGTTVPAKTLAGFLPGVTGYTKKGEPDTWESDFKGIKYSHASQEFHNGGKQIIVALIDYNNISSLTATYLSLINMDIETDHSSHHPITINGNPGWTNWNKTTNSGMVGVYVGNRIFATLEGDGGASIDELKTAASGINYTGLSAQIK